MKHFLDRYAPLRNVPDPGAAGGAPPPAAPPPAAPPPAAPPADGPSWLPPTLPQETREFITAQTFGKNETPEGALLHLHNLHKLSQNNAGVLAKPKDANDADGWNKLYTELGRPEAPDKYEIKLPDGYQADPALLEVARKAAFGMGADPAKAQSLVDGYIEYEKSALAAKVAKTNSENAAAEAQLKQTYGEGFNKFVADGQRAIAALGLSAEDLAFFDQHGKGAVVMKLAAAIGKGMGENPGGFVQAGGGSSGAMTPEQAVEALTALRNTPRFAEIAKAGSRHPEYGATMVEFERLGKLAYPGRRA